MVAKSQRRIFFRERIFLLVFIGLVTACMSVQARDDGDARGPYNVGLQLLDFPYRHDGRNYTLSVAVWYPTTAPQSPHNYSGRTNGFVAIDGAPLKEKGPFPFMLFSHGMGGSGFGYTYFQETLASYGWIVASPDHHDRHSIVRMRPDPALHPDRAGLLEEARKIGKSGPEDRGLYLYRLDEIQTALNVMLVAGPFRSMIDQNRVAVGGHSLGGYTALGVSGAIPERHDHRIKALLLFSTGAGGYLFTENELAHVRVPTMLLFGEKEKGQRRGERTMGGISFLIFDSVKAPKYLLEIKDGHHSSFSTGLTNGIGSWLMSGSQDKFNLINKYSVAFLEHYVAGSEAAGKVLERSDPRLTSFLRK